MSFPERDLQAKLDEMEANLNQKANSDPADQSKSIFNSLPKFGKVAVAIGGVWLGFSVVGAVLHVVTSLFTVAAIGVVLYIGYRLFSSDSESQ